MVFAARRRRARDPRSIPQARAGVVERLGRYSRTLEPGPDDHRAVHRPRQAAGRPARAGRRLPAAAGDHRGQRRGRRSTRSSTSRSPTRKSATYEIANPLQAIEQLTVTTLRNVIGGLTLEDTLTARENVNTELRVVLDEATGKWGIRDQPRRDQVGRPAAGHPGGDGEADARRARPARGDPHRRRREAVADPHRRGREAGGGADAPRASARRRSCAPRAKRRRSTRSSRRSTRADPTRELLSYEYLQMLPQLAEGDANKVFVDPVRVRARRFGGHRRGVCAARRPDGTDVAGGRRRGPAPPERRSAEPAHAGAERAPRAERKPAQMFDSLSEKLQGTLAGVRQRGTLTEEDIDARDARDPPRAARGRRQLQGRQAVHRAVKERALGAEVIGGSTPASRSSRSSTRS